jgi:hypothetical protein
VRGERWHREAMEPFARIAEYPGMNGVAREFWREVYDVRAPVDEPGARRASRGRKKVARRTQTRRKLRGIGSS